MSPVEEKLLAAGLWPAFRTRPYSKVPAPGSRPHAIFVKATDTHPLAPDAEVIVADAAEEFAAGLRLVATLSDGPVYVPGIAVYDLANGPFSGGIDDVVKCGAGGLGGNDLRVRTG